MVKIYIRNRLHPFSWKILPKDSRVHPLLQDYSVFQAFGNEVDYLHASQLTSPPPFREKRHRKNHFEVCKAVHESEYQEVKRPLDTRTKKPIKPAHKFEVALEPDNFTEEKSVVPGNMYLCSSDNAGNRYKLFANYQRVVHREGHNEISKGGFKHFLCAGLERSTLIENGKEKKIGSYHQCYRLDGKLIAMGVLDLLPSCVSSVYLM